MPLNSIDGESFQRMYDANKSARDQAMGSLWELKKTQEELTKRSERAATLDTYARVSTLHTSLAAAGGGLLWAMCSSTGALSALPACHDLAYGKLFPTEGRDLRGLSQLGHPDHVLVRRPTGQFPLPVDGTSRDTGLQSRTTRRGLSTE